MELAPSRIDLLKVEKKKAFEKKKQPTTSKKSSSLVELDGVVMVTLFGDGDLF